MLRLLCMVIVDMTTLMFFFFIDSPSPEIYTLSLHDALPISSRATATLSAHRDRARLRSWGLAGSQGGCRDRKSTRLNSSHVAISYAVFCLKKKKTRTGSRGQTVGLLT